MNEFTKLSVYNILTIGACRDKITIENSCNSCELYIPCQAEVFDDGLRKEASKLSADDRYDYFVKLKRAMVYKQIPQEILFEIML